DFTCFHRKRDMIDRGQAAKTFDQVACFDERHFPEAPGVATGAADLNLNDSKLLPGQFVADSRRVRPRACRVSHDRHRGRLQEGCAVANPPACCVAQIEKYIGEANRYNARACCQTRLSCDLSTYLKSQSAILVIA